MAAAVVPVLYQWSVLPLLVALWAEIICNMRNAPWTRDTGGQGARGADAEPQPQLCFLKTKLSSIKIEY